MFNNAWELGKISGIRIRLHWTFLLLPMWIYFSTMLTGQGTAAAVTSVLFVLAIFGCVLLHELGHAFAARRFGIGTRDIILLPIGGVASLERMPRAPLQELFIAIAGPLVNVVIAIALAAGLMISAVPLGNEVSWFLEQLAVVNIALVVFNMIPAFPMDGGRVLRSCLAMFLEYVRATQIAATVGKYCAIALGIYGLLNGSFMLILLAGFVYLAGQAELKQIIQNAYRPAFEKGNRFEMFRGSGPFAQQQQPFAPQSQPGPMQNQASEPSFEYGQSEISVPASLSGNSVAAWLNSMRAECCSVVDSGRVIGRVTRAQLLTALSRGFGGRPIGQILAHRQQ